jgi:hypothetical protein
MFNPNQAFLLVQKLESAPRAFTLGAKAELEKLFSICPKLVSINAELYGLVLAPRQEKGYHGIPFLLVARLCWAVGLPGLWSLPLVLVSRPFLGAFFIKCLAGFHQYHRIWEANLQPLVPMFQHLIIS